MVVALDSFQYYQLQITCPEEKCSNVLKKIVEITRPVTKIHASLSFMLFVRVHQSKLVQLLGELDQLGIGTGNTQTGGIVEVLPLALTMPLYYVDAVRREKEKEREKKKEEKTNTEVHPRLDSIFNPEDPNSVLPPAESKIDSIFEPIESKIKKSLVGAWETVLEDSKPKEHSSEKKSPRKSHHHHHKKGLSPRGHSKSESSKEVPSIELTPATKSSSHHHKRSRSPRKKVIDKKKSKTHSPRGVSVETRSAATPRAKLWQSLREEEETFSNSGDRLLWGPDKDEHSSGHSKARSVDYGSKFEKGTTTPVQRTLTVPRDNDNSPVLLKKTKEEQSVLPKPKDLDSDDEVDLANEEFSFDDDDKDEPIKAKRSDTITFEVHSDDEATGEDDANFEIEVVDGAGTSTKKVDLNFDFTMDTDEEGDDIVFPVDGESSGEGEIQFTIEENTSGDDDNLFTLDDTPRKPKDQKKNSSSQEIEFTFDDDDDNTEDIEINFGSEGTETEENVILTIETPSSSEKQEKVKKRSSFPNLHTNISRNSSVDTNKGLRISSITDEDRKPMLDSAQTVQKLFQIPDDKPKTNLPEITKAVPPTQSLPARGGSKIRAPRQIIAEKFIVHDKAGNERGSFGLGEDNSISIQLSDAMSHRTIKIHISSHSEHEMGMHFSVDGKRRLSHHVNDQDDVETAMYGTDFYSHSKMRVNVNSPELTLGIKDQTLINLRGTQDISELNPSNALVSLRSDPGFSGLSICDTLGGTRATFGWYDLKKLLRLENETDLVMIQMSGRAASQDLDNFPEATISVIDNVAKLYAKDKNGGIKEFPAKKDDDDVSVLVNIEKAGAQLGLVIDGALRTLGPAKTQQLLNAYGFNL